jgi:hypothetical protein
MYAASVPVYIKIHIRYVYVVPIADMGTCSFVWKSSRRVESIATVSQY